MTSGYEKATAGRPATVNEVAGKPRFSRVLVDELHRNLIHIRWPVQSYVLLGFLFGSLIAKHVATGRLALGLVSWFLICAGLTVFNSYYDKDESPVGGMAKPPKVTASLLYGSLAMQGCGLAIAVILGGWFLVLAVIVVLLYILYSHRAFRLKSNGYAAVAINSVLGALTVLAAASLGRAPGALALAFALATAACFKAGAYMMMQVHQIEEDRERGDISLAVIYGRNRTLRIAMVFIFVAGLFAAAAVIAGIHAYVVAAFVLGYFALMAYRFTVWIKRPEDAEQDYATVRNMVYLSGYLGSVIVLATFVYYSAAGY